MRRSDIYEYIQGSHRIRALILSADPFNPRRATYAQIINPARIADVPGIVRLASADPATGIVDATRLRPLDPANLSAHLGRLTPATMARVDDALRLYLGL